MRRILAIVGGLASLTLLATSLPLVPALAQGGANPRLIFQTTLPNARQIKYPDVAAAGNQVYLSANINRADAVVWQKNDSAQSFPAPTTLGAAPGQPDFSATSVATGPDGSAHVMWMNQDQRRVYYRKKPVNGTWGPQRLVYQATRSTEFPVNGMIEVASDGVPWITWRDPDFPAKVTRSSDEGQTWTSPVTIGTNAVINYPMLAAGPGGAMAIAFTAGVRSIDKLQVFAGAWNGSIFVTQNISPAPDDFADPTATYSADGALLVSYRSEATSGPLSGAWLSSRTGNDPWQTNRIGGPAEYKGTVNIDTDTAGTVHMQWNANAGAGFRVYYTVRPRTATAFTTPVDAPNDAGVIFNSRMDTSVSDLAYAHVAGELFAGDSSFVRYLLFAATAGVAVGAQPVIENGEAISEREPTVTLSFTNVQGTPTQIRWRWGAEPTDAATDSNGWVAFANPMNIPLPASILENAPCSAERLFTQVREADNDTGVAQSDDIIIDTGINAALAVGNPNLSSKAREFTPIQSVPADVSSGGASDGDPGYTRDPIYYLGLQGTGDCSGVKDVSVGRNTTSVNKAILVSKEAFANVLPYPGAMIPGPNQLLVRVSDLAGNVTDYTQTIILDQVKPVLSAMSPGTLVVTSDAKATILARLAFSGVSVTDDRYPGRGYWGVWVANSRTEVANPTTDSSLVWLPLKAPATGNDFSISNWSLASGLSGALQPGTYHVYVRFLDGAGNPTDGFLKATVTLSQITRPQVSLPVVRR